MNEPSTERNPVEELADDFVQRYRRGERPALSEYTGQFPELAEQIRDLFPALVMMEDIRPSEAEGAEGADAASAPSLVQVGDFRILREIGRGGMGIVYEAEQMSLGRRVALKVLPASALLDPRKLQRFRREAKASAGLHHTNIVPVYGVGSEADVHFIVMQYIPGHGLDVVLRELRCLRGLDVAEGSRENDGESLAQNLLSGQFQPSARRADGNDSGRANETETASVNLPKGSASSWKETGRPFWHSVARICVQAADALDHAHNHGLLHRDIKPSNLLLDPQGVVWVTDFGLAKTAQDAEDLTHSGDLIGTMRYMAPESFRGEADSRSDIYSLGLTLYELLTLKPAFAHSGRERLKRQAAHEEPPRPSKLNPAIPRDLETIVLKAIALEPQHRYQSARELAADLRCFLEDKPIQARRASTSERVVKWARRRPAIAFLSALVVVVGIGGIGGVIWQWRDAVAALQREQIALDDAKKAKAKADQEAERARREAQAAREVADVLMGIFQQSDSLGLSGYLLQSKEISSKPGAREFTAHALLDSSAAKIRRELGQKPLVQAKLFEGIGAVYLSIGELDKADSLLQSSLVLRERHDGADSPETARCLAGLGIIRFAHGRLDESTDLLDRALAAQRHALKEGDPQIRTTEFLRAFVEARRVENPETLRDLEVKLRALAAIQTSEFRERDLSLGLLTLSSAWFRQGDLLKAVLLVGEHDLLCKDRKGPLYQIMRIRIPLAFNYRKANDQKNATRVFRESLAKVRATLGQDHPVVYFVELELAMTLEKLEDWPLAEVFYRDALTTATDVMGRQPRTAMAMEDLARVLYRRGRSPEASKLLTDALELRIATQGAEHADVAALRQRISRLQTGPAVLDKKR